MAQRLAQDLWKLEIPLVGNPLKNLNSYLLTGGERSLLIDTGFRQDPCREAMERQLAEIGVDRERMDIFLTHLHSDHTGLAPELIRPGGRIYISAIDGSGLEDGLEDAYWEDVYREYVRNGFSWEEIHHLWDSNPAQGAAPKPWNGRCTLLGDGDRLTYGGRTLRCILTPGHTPGHLCLYDEEKKRLFAGDHILFHITPNICRWPSMPDALGSYLASLDAIRDLEVRELYPAHRAETGALAPRVDELKAHHARRIENAWQAVRSAPGATAYEIAGRMAWSIRSRSWSDFPLTQKFFAVGETLAHLDYLTLRGRVRQWEEGSTVRYAVTEDPSHTHSPFRSGQTAGARTRIAHLGERLRRQRSQNDFECLRAKIDARSQLS